MTFDLFKVMALSALLTTFSLPRAFAVGGRPLKLMTCELMLQPSMESLSVRENVLPVLRDAIFKVKKTIPDSANDGTNFKNIGYAGPLSKMSLAKATAIVQRLNGIEQNLVSHNLDEQIVSVEIRGNDNIRKALASLDANSAKLEQIYEAESQDVFSKARRIGGQAADTLAVSIAASTAIGSFLGAVGSVAVPSLQGFMQNETAYVLSMLGAGMMVDYQLIRRDWKFNSLKNFLTNLIENKSTADFYISSNRFAMPTEFHQMLMSNQPDSEARKIALKQWGGSFTDFVIAEMTDEFNFRRDVNNAGENFRRTFMDQIVFYDEAAKEPVWLFFYRAFRKRPQSTPMKPKNKIGTQQRDYEWAGGLVPSPIPIPVPVRAK